MGKLNLNDVLGYQKLAIQELADGMTLMISCIQQSFPTVGLPPADFINGRLRELDESLTLLICKEIGLVSDDTTSLNSGYNVLPSSVGSIVNVVVGCTEVRLHESHMEWIMSNEDSNNRTLTYVEALTEAGVYDDRMIDPKVTVTDQQSYLTFKYEIDGVSIPVFVPFSVFTLNQLLAIFIYDGAMDQIKNNIEYAMGDGDVIHFDGHKEFLKREGDDYSFRWSTYRDSYDSKLLSRLRLYDLNRFCGYLMKYNDLHPTGISVREAATELPDKI